MNIGHQNTVDYNIDTLESNIVMESYLNIVSISRIRRIQILLLMVSMPHWPLYLGPIHDGTESPQRVLEILDIIGNPQLKLKNIFHITGTNGKGSTAQYIAQILRQCKKDINIYTSPHIYECNERIVISGKKITDEQLYYYTEKIRSVCEENNINPTIFESTTIVALLAFSENNADANIIEVGMGGRNDATNVFESHQISATIFTSIHVDHKLFLGDKPYQNAFEKSFIAKHGNIMIIGPQCIEVLSILSNHAKQNNCKTYIYGDDFEIEKDGENMILYVSDRTYRITQPGLLGDHQIINASVACAAVLYTKIVPNIIETQLSSGIANVKWPVRLERIYNNSLLDHLPNNSELYIDGAHNVSGAYVIAQFLKSHIDNIHNYIIIGRTRNTDSFEFLKQFSGIIKMAVAIRVLMEALPEAPEIISKAGNDAGVRTIVGKNLEDAMVLIREQSNSMPARIIICGSLYLARDVKQYKHPN